MNAVARATYIEATARELRYNALASRSLSRLARTPSRGKYRGKSASQWVRQALHALRVARQARETASAILATEGGAQ